MTKGKLPEDQLHQTRLLTLKTHSYANARPLHVQAFIPFGLGPRTCPGEALAWRDMRLFLAMALRQLSMTLAMPESEVVPVERFVTWAANDIWLDLAPR